MPALKDVLQGKPLHTPLHAALVHLPISLFPLAVLIDVASWIANSPNLPLVQAAFVALLVGLGTALLAAVFGSVDYIDIRDDHPAKKTATAHLVGNLLAVGLFAASAGLRFSALEEPRTPVAPLAVALVGLAVLGYSGYLGGKLVYDDGIGVGRHRRRSRPPASTLVITSDNQPVVVAGDHELREGETLRVNVNGVVAAVTRLDGNIYAFQEFCSHRYGPLSEGKLSGCEVTCPWHRSRFDVRTGKVTHGPAKVDLRIFRTEIREGKIWVWSNDQPAR